MGYVLLVVAFTLNAVANVLLKNGSRAIGEEGGMSISALATNYLLLGGVFLFALNMVAYTVALSRLPLSIAYPIMVAGTLLVVTLFSALYLGESITIVQFTGLILLGVSIILIVGHW